MCQAGGEDVLSRRYHCRELHPPVLLHCSSVCHRAAEGKNFIACVCMRERERERRERVRGREGEGEREFDRNSLGTSLSTPS